MIADGAQAAGAIPVSVEELAVDAYAIAGHKWLLGPEGMAALWVRRGLADSLTPAHASFLSYEVFDPQRPVLRAGARRFEATGYHRPSVVGLARSCGWISMYVGLPWAHERATRLAAGGGRPAGRDPRGHARDAARGDGDAGHLPDRGLAGRHRGRGARVPCVRDPRGTCR